MNEKQKTRNFGNRDYLKVTRGMVFWYDLNPKVNKYSSPKVEAGGKLYPDHKQYGSRDWLVVSNDINNGNSPTCTVVPISTQGQKTTLPTHIHFTYMGNKLTIMCEQIQTINMAELLEYRYTVSDRVMDRVDEALVLQLGISKKHLYLDGDVVDNAFEKIESIIEGIIKSKVKQISIQKASRLDVEDAVLRIGEGLETLLKENGLDNSISSNSETSGLGNETNVISESKILESNLSVGDTRSMSQTEKFYARYPDRRPEPQKEDKIQKQEVKSQRGVKTSTKISKSKKKSSSDIGHKRREWTEESMKEFLKDVQELSPTECAMKWEFDTIKRMYGMKYYVQTKLDKIKKDS